MHHRPYVLMSESFSYFFPLLFLAPAVWSNLVSPRCSPNRKAFLSCSLSIDVNKNRTKIIHFLLALPILQPRDYSPIMPENENSVFRRSFPMISTKETGEAAAQREPQPYDTAYGDWRATLVVFGGFCALFVSIGWINC